MHGAIHMAKGCPETDEICQRVAIGLHMNEIAHMKPEMERKML